MHYVIIACRVMYREISYLCSKTRHKTEVVWLPQGLHDTPDVLRAELQKEINKIEERETKPDAILLGYGMCSNGVCGIEAKTIPVIVPKTDDCIAIFLGSQKRYLECFHKYPGTYWYNMGWIENAFTPSLKSLAEKKAEYVEQYGEENGEYIFEVTNNYVDKYNYGIYITSPVYDRDDCKEYARQAAKDLGWNFKQLEGNITVLEKMINGEFDETFLICNPGNRIIATENEEKMTFEPIK